MTCRRLDYECAHTAHHKHMDPSVILIQKFPRSHAPKFAENDQAETWHGANHDVTSLNM